MSSETGHIRLTVAESDERVGRVHAGLRRFTCYHRTGTMHALHCSKSMHGFYSSLHLLPLSSPSSPSPPIPPASSRRRATPPRTTISCLVVMRERERDETCCYFVIVGYILSSKQAAMYTLFLHHVRHTHHQTQPSGRLQSVQVMRSLHQIIRNHNAMNPITQRRRTHRKKPILLTKSWCVSSRRGWITEAYFLMSCFRSL